MPLNWKDNTGYNQVNLGGGALVVADHILAGINKDPTKSIVNGAYVPAYLFTFTTDDTTTLSISSGVSIQTFRTYYAKASNVFNSSSLISGATLVTTLSTQGNNYVKSELEFNLNVSLSSAYYSLVEGTNHYQIQVSTYTPLGSYATSFANTFARAYSFNASSPSLTDNFYSSFQVSDSTYTFTSSYTLSVNPFTYSALGVPSEISVFVCNKSF